MKTIPDEELFKNAGKAPKHYNVALDILNALADKNQTSILHTLMMDEENGKFTIFLFNTVNHGSVLITIKIKEYKTIIEHYGQNEPRAFNLGKVVPLINTYFINYREDEENLELINKTIFCLNQDTDFSLWIKQGNNPKIKATNCDISDLHETDVIAFEIQDIDELKDDYIILCDGTKLSLDPLYQKHKQQEKGSYFVVYNLRRELFLYSNVSFHKHFYFE